MGVFLPSREEDGAHGHISFLPFRRDGLVPILHACMGRTEQNTPIIISLAFQQLGYWGWIYRVGRVRRVPLASTPPANDFFNKSISLRLNGAPEIIGRKKGPWHIADRLRLKWESLLDIWADVINRPHVTPSHRQLPS